MVTHVPLSNGGFALVDDEDAHLVVGRKWWGERSRNAVYAFAHVPGTKGSRVQMHRFLVAPPKGLLVDHENRNGLDNRRENLRVVTSAQNAANSVGKRPGRPKGTSRLPSGRWRARIMANGTGFHLGVHDTEEEAAAAYDEAARRLFGEYARPNTAEA